MTFTISFAFVFVTLYALFVIGLSVWFWLVDQRVAPGLLIVGLLIGAIWLFSHWWLFLIWTIILFGLIGWFITAGLIGKIISGILIFAILVGGVYLTSPYTKVKFPEFKGEALVEVATEEVSTSATPTPTPVVVYCDPSAIPYGSYALVAGKVIEGPAVVEWWDQTPATIDPVTGKLNLAAMKGHEGIQFLMSGETITPAMGLVGSVFPLTSDNDLLCVKNQHLLKFYSKPQHIYATSPEELIILVPVMVPTK